MLDMSDKLKLKWILSLVCDRCNKAWAIDGKDWCEECSMEREFESLGWNETKDEAN